MIRDPVRELIGWRIAADVCELDTLRLMTAELHGGGGQYDELVVADSSGGYSGALVLINRGGGIHVMGGNRPRWDFDDAARNHHEIVTHAEEALRLREPETRPAGCVASALVAKLAQAVLERMPEAPFTWENGMADSDYGACWRSDLLDAFPEAGARSAEGLPGLWGNFRFWILTDRQRHVACVDQLDGTCWWGNQSDMLEPTSVSDVARAVVAAIES